MANKKISELPYINVSKISGNTLVPLVTYFSATTGDTVHTYVDDLQTYLISGLTGQTDVFVTGGTYSAGTITITNNTGGTFNITGLTTGSTTTIGGNYLPLSGGTVTGNTIFNQGLSASTISATTYLNLPITTDVFVTGGTYSNGDATFTNNTGGTFNVTGFYTGSTDIFVSGGTYSAGTITFTNTSGGTFNVTGLTTGSTSIVSGDYLPLSGGTVTGKTDFQSGVTINILTATTIVNTYLDSFYIRDNGGTLSIDNTTRRLLKSDGSTTSFDWENGILTGQTNVESSTISATTYQNLPDNITGNYLPLSGGTVTGNTVFNSGLTANTISADTLTITDNINSTNRTLYDSSNVSSVDWDNRQLLDENGNTTIVWSTQRTLEHDNGAVLDWSNQKLNDYLILESVDWNNRTLSKTDATTSFDWENGILTGQTNIESSTISATTYQNLPLGIYGTGLTFNTGNYDLTLDGQNGTLDTISLSILASDLTVTGGTYDPNTGVATFTNNTGGTFTVTGFLTGFTNTFVTGGTYSAGTITFTNTSGGTFDVTGLTTGDTTTITGATSVGTGLTIFDSVVNRNIQINSITGDSLNKITTTLNSNTIEVGINEPNLTLWPLVVNGNRLVDGGVSYVSGLTFDVSPLTYIIAGSLYTVSATTQVTLNSGDSTYDRIDVIFADISGNTNVLEGTPSANPEKPIVDSTTQVEVTFVSVPVSSTTAGISTELIYDENVGQPTEWNFLKFGNQTFRISGDSTAQSYSGSKSISVSGLTTSGGNYSNGFVLSATSLADTNQYATLEFAIRNMSGNSNNTYILIQFLGPTGLVLNGASVWIYGGPASGQYINYSASNTSSWQLISIPLWRFYLTNTNVYGIKFSYLVGSTVARHYFDRIRLVEGTASSPPSNSWTTIKGDSTTTITAPNPNATLTISGGTNISSSISGTSTVVLNLDNNINLNGVTTSTISATTYQNLPDNITGNYLPLSGGTVTGSTIFTNGLSANTISATTYQNLPLGIYGTGLTFDTGNYNLTLDGQNGSLYTISLSILASDLTVTGGTYDPNTGVATFTNNTGGTFNVTGFLTGFTDTFVTGGTYSAGVITFTNTSGGTFDVTGLTTGSTSTISGDYLPLSGGTVTGNTVFTENISVTGGTGINWISGNTSTDLLRVTQTGTGNAFVVEDSTNPDNTPFVITSGGSTFLGTLTGYTSAGGVITRFQVSDGNSGVVFSGLPNATTAVFQSDQGSNIGLLSPDANNSQIYFGTPSDAFGSYLRWDYTNKNLFLSTANSTGKIIFNTNNSVEAARIDQNGNFGIGLTGATQKFEVSGNSRIIGSLSAQTGYLSGSGQNILTVIGSGNSTTSPLFSVQGSSGELFSVSDSLVGSLFSVNDISGLPIMEVFSDNTTLWGSYQAPSLNTTVKTSAGTGSTTVYTIPQSAYTGAFFEYTVSSTSGARAGSIMSIFSGSSVQYTETTTNDIGSTTGLTFSVSANTTNVVLLASGVTAGWTIKTIVRSI